MRRILLQFLMLVMLLSAQTLRAQRGGYWLTASSGAYNNLSGSGVNPASSSTPWDSTASFSAVIGFSFTIDTSTINIIQIHKENSFCVDTFRKPILQGFLALNATLADRGSSTSASPISYQITGTTGSRIFALEVKNAGFAVEQSKYATSNDFISYQIWFYEGTNVVEIHYGPSQVSHATDYFSYSGGFPIIGFSNRKDLTGDGTIYIATGSTSSLSNIDIEDSVVFTSYNPTYVGSGLFPPFPPSGTILKFSPIKTSVSNVNVKEAHVYPTLCKSEVLVDYFNIEPTSYEVVSVKGIPITMKGTLQNGTTHIDISRLAAGTYLLQLQNSTGKFVQKFVKF